MHLGASYFFRRPSELAAGSHIAKNRELLWLPRPRVWARGAGRAAGSGAGGRPFYPRPTTRLDSGSIWPGIPRIGRNDNESDLDWVD
jgi:hypothetical protein